MFWGYMPPRIPQESYIEDKAAYAGRNGGKRKTRPTKQKQKARRKR